MPATKAKSKVTRTLRRKRHCPDCHNKSVHALDLACKLERAEYDRDRVAQDFLNAACSGEREFYRLGLLLDAISVSLERASVDIARKESILRMYERAWNKGQPEPVARPT